MGISLHRYLHMKVHQLVDTTEWDRLIVRGIHDRSSTSVIFAREKRDKPFNWMRPTARHIGNDIHIQCFPGDDHVEHYAALLATYLRINRPESMDVESRVLFEPSTSADTIHMLSNQTNLLQVPKADIVVLGLVHRLENAIRSGQDFAGSNLDEFAWQVQQTSDGKTAISRMSFELLGLNRGGFGPCAGLAYWFLATGGYSMVKGKEVRWPNAFESVVRQSVKDGLVIEGLHETLPSVLFETEDWLQRAKATGHDFVDPEVGHMAQAAVENQSKFGYLHIISDNVARKYSEDLSNERDSGVLQGRDYLYRTLDRYVESYMVAC